MNQHPPSTQTAESRVDPLIHSTSLREGVKRFYVTNNYHQESFTALKLKQSVAKRVHVLPPLNGQGVMGRAAPPHTLPKTRKLRPNLGPHQQTSNTNNRLTKEICALLTDLKT